MLTVRASEARGHADHGWLDSRHTFSFANYYDPQHMGFRSLRVINEDRVAPGMGFGAHPHRDMEILSYVVDGALEHRDSLGTGSIIRPGDVQRMSAGTGVVHSEYNPSADEPVHFLQIWIQPAVRGITPSYEQRHFEAAEKHNRLRLVAAPDGADGALTIHQDVRLYASLLDAETEVIHPLSPERHLWLQVVRGALQIGDRRLSAGDGAAISGIEALTIRAEHDSELLLFDLA